MNYRSTKVCMSSAKNSFLSLCFRPQIYLLAVWPILQYVVLSHILPCEYQYSTKLSVCLSPGIASFRPYLRKGSRERSRFDSSGLVRFHVTEFLWGAFLDQIHIFYTAYVRKNSDYIIYFLLYVRFGYIFLTILVIFVRLKTVISLATEQLTSFKWRSVGTYFRSPWA